MKIFSMFESTISDENVVIIRTLECDMCQRFDSIQLSLDEFYTRINANSLKIGIQNIPHGDHVRISYFDENKKYLGDTISLNIKSETSLKVGNTIPNFNINTKKTNSSNKKLLNMFIKKTHSISILGPSLAGKTSLSIYMESGKPEKIFYRFHYSPTMGKSIKHLKIGNSNLKITDLGGQKSFWKLWKEEVEESDKLIFIIDVTANNKDEIIESLKIILKYRYHENQPILILLNKYDLILEGYTNNIVAIDEIFNQLDLYQINNIWIIKSSILNGVAYDYVEDNQESNLGDVILDYLEI
ncbi:MAG: ADP-ribosylation factor-like protein [Candidatus Heimdallarchaeota archaeon]|nr:ADP-ribosylation factor-like protein [Candidatus Heimdallarchaeota archaeon]